MLVNITILSAKVDSEGKTAGKIKKINRKTKKFKKSVDKSEGV